MAEAAPCGSSTPNCARARRTPRRARRGRCRRRRGHGRAPRSPASRSPRRGWGTRRHPRAATGPRAPRRRGTRACAGDPPRPAAERARGARRRTGSSWPASTTITSSGRCESALTSSSWFLCGRFAATFTTTRRPPRSSRSRSASTTLAGAGVIARRPCGTTSTSSGAMPPYCSISTRAAWVGVMSRAEWRAQRSEIWLIASVVARENVAMRRKVRSCSVRTCGHDDRG